MQLHPATHLEVVLADFVAQVVVPQARQVGVAAVHLAHTLGEVAARACAAQADGPAARAIGGALQCRRTRRHGPHALHGAR
jgi:hypothetical protein